MPITPTRSPNSEKLAGITSYWAQMTNTKETRPRYNIGKHGIMGEIGHWTLPILFRYKRLDFSLVIEFVFIFKTA